MIKRVFIAAVLVIVLAVLFQQFSTPEISFEQGFNELKSIWAKQGINVSDLENEGEKISLLSTSQTTAMKEEINSFKNNLSQYKESDSKQALLEAAELYVNFIDVVSLSKTIDALDERISEIALLEGCENISTYKQRNTLRRQRLDLLEKFSASASSFAQKYPSQNAVAGFVTPDFDFEEIQADLQAKEDAVQLLEETC